MKHMRVIFVISCLLVFAVFAQGQTVPPISQSGITNSAVSNPEPPKSVDQLLSANPKLTAKVESLLPQGTNVKSAARSFLDLDQFVAAVHVSNNLKIPFDQLSDKLTGAHPVDLKKAIHELKPDVDNKAEAKKANEQAKEDIKDSKRKG